MRERIAIFPTGETGYEAAELSSPGLGAALVSSRVFWAALAFFAGVLFGAAAQAVAG